MTIAELLDVLWRDYVAMTPQAERIRRLLTQRGEILCNDHVTLRTYGTPGIGIETLARPFEVLGWRMRDRYRFRDQHLRASYWQHDDDTLPRLLISELVVEELSPDAQDVIGALVRQPSGGFDPADTSPWAWLPWRRCAWRATHADYAALLAESEYAGWVAAFGPGVHHFTVDVGSLSMFPDLEALAAFLIDHGFRLQDAGGARGGLREFPLQRLSTRADSAVVCFADATVRIPSCRYEFARRGRLRAGERVRGMVRGPDGPLEPTDIRISI